MNAYQWSNEETARLQELFPITGNEELANIFGVTISQVRNQAKRLGLQKSPFKTSDLKNLEIFKENYKTRSYSEIAKMMGISKSSVFRIANKLNLKKSDEETTTVCKRIRRSMIERDLRRIRLGLKPLTGIIRNYDKYYYY
jgi:DNA-binding MarR family transcriptional regulator